MTWLRRDLLPLLFCGLVGCAAREPAPFTEPSTSPIDRRRPSLVDLKFRRPPLPTTAGESGQVIPLHTPDLRYAEYFAELKRWIEDKWTYPSEASRKGQSGGGEVRCVLLRDGSVRTAEIVRSSGVPVLDVYITNAIPMVQSFRPIPASVADGVLSISIDVTDGPKGAQ